MTELTPVQRVPGTSRLIEVRVSTPDADTAQAIATQLVDRHLAACVQILGPITSVYSWKRETHQALEWLLLAKTTAERFDAVSELVTSRHPYEVPEVVAVTVRHSLDSYGAWVRDVVHDGDD
ncbi:divalent-cation tolerance protein CutA [Ornithinimicrobium cavernae]|uniref:divalent-cation tolerance protein CutA n=1 Tax=Ornithinimicrobium cavernae TaxID=2666047 RepID=UPI000D688BBB|nr:divalent-cation tolerance protein CutA [Ornithinimicrobium cavernae]